MSIVSFSTDQFNQFEQFSAWKEVVCEQFMSLQCDASVFHGEFYGKVVMRPAENFSVCNLNSIAHNVSRTTEMISRDHKACYYINHQVSGHCSLTDHRGRSSTVFPGQSFLVSSDEYFTMQFDDQFEHFVVEIPQDAIDYDEELIGSLINVDCPEDRLINSIVRQLYVESPFLSDDFLVGSLQSVSTLISGKNRKSNFDIDSLRGNSRARSILHEVKSFIRENLGDPRLSVEVLVSKFNISRRTLYRNFDEYSMSPQQYIGIQRIELAKKIFRNNPKVSVAEVCFRCGFVDTSNFSKKFRAVTGCSPREYRERV